jgi:hypothetical protein
MPSKVQDTIIKVVHKMPSGDVFSAKDMAAHGSRDAVDQALHRLAAAGIIRRIHWGLYDKPKFSKYLGKVLSPNSDKVAKALARKFNWDLKPTGATTLNQLGVSTQVPGRLVFLSSGPSKTYMVGKRTIEFRHVAPKDLDFRYTGSSRLVQALKSIGNAPLDELTISRLSPLLAKDQKDRIIMDTRSATSWIHDRIKQLSEAAPCSK